MAESRLKQGPVPSYQLLEPENVAEEIATQVFKGESGGQVINPARLNSMTGMRAFPIWLQIFLKELFFPTAKISSEETGMRWDCQDLTLTFWMSISSVYQVAEATYVQAMMNNTRSN